MKRHCTTSSVVLRGVVGCLAVGALMTACGDDDDSSSTTGAEATTAATAEASTTEAMATTPETAPEGDACADRDALRASVAALGDVDVIAEGTNGVTAAVDQVKADLEAVRASAGSNVRPLVDAVQDALAALETGLGNLGDGGAVEVSTAITALSTATSALVDGLQDVPCG